MAAKGERARQQASPAPSSPKRGPAPSHGARRRPVSTAGPQPAVACAGGALLLERLAALEPRPWHACGSFDAAAPPTLTFTSAEGQRVTLALGAGRPDAELAPLLADASPSPFAKAGKTVVDPSYRDAAELLPASFESGVALPPKVRAADTGKRAGTGRGAPGWPRTLTGLRASHAALPARCQPERRVCWPKRRRCSHPRPRACLRSC